GAESDFQGYIDLLTMKATVYTSDDGKKYEERDVPENLKATADEWREKLIESISDFDDTVAERYLGGEDISVDELKKAIRKGTLAGKIVPVICGS
ncbi:elongation factor G, partial [Acinetobacter baumannii]